MSKSIRFILATMAGITACALAYFLSAMLLQMFLQWLAGDPAIFQEIYRDFGDNPILLILRLAVGLYFGVIGFRVGWKYFGKFGIPGVLSPYSEAVGATPISVRVYVNGEDELGQLARLEVFSCKLTAATLHEFYWADNPKPLVIRGKDGLYLQLIKTGKSPYDADNASDEPTIAVKVRTRTRVLHSLECVFGQQPTFVVLEGKPIAYFRMALDYVGSQTDSNGMLVCNGNRGLMESVFLKQPKVATARAEIQSTTAAVSSDRTNENQQSDPRPATQPAT